MRLFLILVVFTCRFICMHAAKGQVWTSMGQEFTNNRIAALIRFDNKIFAGGTYYSSTSSLDNIAWWDGANWNPVGPGMLGGVYSMGDFNGELYAAGSFSSIQGCTGCKKIARWDGTSWHSLKSGVTDGDVECTAVYNGDLYVGGSILSVDSMPMKNLARWDGADWHSVCAFSGGLSQLFCMTVFNNELYIGGYFWSLNGNTMYNIAKFDGTIWSEVGGGTGGIVSAMYPDTINNRLYVSGNIVHVNSGTTPCPSNVAYWDGTIWHPVGNGPQLTPKEMTIFKNELYVGFGSFPVNSSGDTLACIARWDGTDWQSVGGGVNCNVHAFLPMGNDLIVGGCFTQAGDSAVSLIAVWKDTITSVNNLPENLEMLKIIPNPFRNTATVKVPNRFKDKTPLVFELYNTKGKQVLKREVHSFEFEISREALPSGIYLYYLRNKKIELASGKIVIQ
jgi:trimeric autotransporter adhesin